jgi:hypothetical protein
MKTKTSVGRSEIRALTRTRVISVVHGYIETLLRNSVQFNDLCLEVSCSFGVFVIAKTKLRTEIRRADKIELEKWS